MKSKHLLHLLMMALLVPGIVNAQNLPANGPKTESWQDLTINSNVSNYVSYYVPFSGRSVVEATSSQFIIPATSLVDMVGSKVRKLTFYSNEATKDWGTAQFKVFMAEVPNDQFTQNAYIPWQTLTQVYEGSVSLSNYQMTITLSQQFTYTGENLLVGFDLSQTGTGDPTGWLYAETNKSSAMFYVAISENPQSVVVEENTTSYLPKMTFNYQVLPYQRVYPVIPVVDGNTVNLSWEAPNDQVTGYAYQCRNTMDAWSEEWTETQNTSVEITDLDFGREYEFRIKALYGSNESVSTKVSFVIDCSATPMLLNGAYLENFDTYSINSTLMPNEHVMPRCWESVNACSSTTSSNRLYPTMSSYLTKFENNTTPFAYSPNNSLLFYIDKNQSDPQPQYAIMPAMQHIQLMQVTCQAVKAKLRAGDWNSWSGTFKVGVMEEDGTFTEVESFTLPNYGSGGSGDVPYPTVDNFTTCVADFSNYSGTGNRIAFMMDVPASTTVRYGRIYIDDISVDYTVPMPSTFIKEIDPWVDGTGTEEPGGWYLISSPLLGNTNPADVQNMLNNTNPEYFDLYRFEQNNNYFDGNHDLEWENWKYNNFNLEPLRGYLYANRDGLDLTFTGVPYYGDGIVVLKKEETHENGAPVEFPGWNLIGNPWATNATITNSYYRINADGNEVIGAVEGTSIAPMEAVFVIAENDGDTETFTKVTRNETSGMTMALNLSSVNNKVIDRTILRFDNGSILPKFQLNPNHTKVYIPQNGKDYAVVNAEGQGEMPINFRAAENGNYTLSFSKDNVEFSYLHLIDNMTSDDIDLLSTPSYTFKAKTSDYESRFKLVYASNSKTEGDESFGFINESGNFSVYGIEGEATLQMIDMTGRVISTDTFNGSIEKKIDITNGIYMFRLINGDNVKVQKVVVK